jgi:hypothetical protein
MEKCFSKPERDLDYSQKRFSTSSPKQSSLFNWPRPRASYLWSHIEQSAWKDDNCDGGWPQGVTESNNMSLLSNRIASAQVNGFTGQHRLATKRTLWIHVE